MSRFSRYLLATFFGNWVTNEGSIVCPRGRVSVLGSALWGIESGSLPVESFGGQDSRGACVSWRATNRNADQHPVPAESYIDSAVRSDRQADGSEGGHPILFGRNIMPGLPEISGVKE